MFIQPIYGYLWQHWVYHVDTTYVGKPIINHPQNHLIWVLYTIPQMEAVRPDKSCYLTSSGTKLEASTVFFLTGYRLGSTLTNSGNTNHRGVIWDHLGMVKILWLELPNCMPKY
jgi:hypothetical protein